MGKKSTASPALPPFRSPRLAALAQQKEMESMMLEQNEKKEKKDKKKEKSSKEEEREKDDDADMEDEESSKKSKKEKKDKKRKAEDDVQAPEEEEHAMNAKKQKKDKKEKEKEKEKGKEKEKEKIKEKEADKSSESEGDGTDANGNPPLTKFRVSARSIAALKKHEITHMFPIQAATYDLIFEGKDVVGRARTGTGKTLAFTLPMIERMLSNTQQLSFGRLPRVIVLTPTRELALQIVKTVEMLTAGTQLSTMCVYGGSPYGPQEGALRRGCDVVVGTCGRIKDLLEKGTLKLERIQYVVMDEADEMLNMGFADDVELILSNVPRANKDKESDAKDASEIQTLLFSATIPAWVESVARKYLRPSRVNIDLVKNTEMHASADVQHYAMACHYSERNSVLGEVIQVYGGPKSRTIIFTETKKEANELLMEPSIKGLSQALHGDIPQAQRENTLKGFRDGRFQVLIATDVAARGLDIPGVELVIQCEPPEKVEDYIHRSGRTGRANKKGTCVTFYTPKQLYYINNIEQRGKVKFIRVGAPQQADIVKSSVTEAVKQVKAVNAEVIPYFLNAAKQLIEDAEEKGSENENGSGVANILAAALARVAGFTEPIKQRSLLTSASNMITVHLKVKGGNEIRSLSYIWSIIRRYLFEDADDKVKGMRLTADRAGACFDIPSSYEKTIKELTPADQRISFTMPSELPELVPLQIERPEPKHQPWKRQSGGGGGGFRGGRGGGGFRGGRGGRR